MIPEQAAFLGELKGELKTYRGIGRRGARACGYFIVSATLLSMNTYGIDHKVGLAITIGLLGAFTRSAFIGQVCIAILAAMAVIPTDAIRLAADAIGGR